MGVGGGQAWQARAKAWETSTQRARKHAKRVGGGGDGATGREASRGSGPRPTLALLGATGVTNIPANSIQPHPPNIHHNTHHSRFPRYGASQPTDHPANPDRPAAPSPTTHSPPAPSSECSGDARTGSPSTQYNSCTGQRDSWDSSCMLTPSGNMVSMIPRWAGLGCLAADPFPMGNAGSPAPVEHLHCRERQYRTGQQAQPGHLYGVPGARMLMTTTAGL
ncbi:hypothetical protein F5884DRAFT_753497 [Xylogone sp. PMI_703]|nr:hypothetical protein F5884DRAFT_753497 [Xylogone sp. PMI_703]